MFFYRSITNKCFSLLLIFQTNSRAFSKTNRIIFCSCQTHNGCAGVRRIILPCELSSLEQQFKYRGYLEADVYIVNVTKHTKIKSLLAITFSFSYKVKQLQLYYISHMPILTFHNFTIMNTTL